MAAVLPHTAYYGMGSDAGDMDPLLLRVMNKLS